MLFRALLLYTHEDSGVTRSGASEASARIGPQWFDFPRFVEVEKH